MNASDPSPDLLGCEVFDAGGQRIGRLNSFYRDLDDETVYFAAVDTTRSGRHLLRRLVLVPLVDATIGPVSVTLRCGALLARRAPHARPGHSLPADLEADLYRHYEIPYVPSHDGTARLQPVE